MNAPLHPLLAEDRLRRIASSVCLAVLLMALTSTARAAPVAGPEINPFACQGQAESLMADRSISQISDELEKRMDPIYEAWDPPTVRAIKICVVAELKKRVGQGDAAVYYLRAIETNPDEPGFEFFAGRYYGGARGVRGPVLEMAEKHYYNALEKLEALQTAGRYRDYHAVVEDHTQKGLLVLYQQDGLPLLPWKAFRQRPSGYPAPGLSVASQVTVSKDTRDSLGANEVGGFSAEAGLRSFRNPEPISAREKFDIVRNPLRYRSLNTLRLRHTYIGAVDVMYNYFKAEEAAIPIFNTPSAPKVDVTAKEYGIGYDRVIPLYPLFDARLTGSVKRVERVGVVEYNPTYQQDFNVYEVRPAISRFLGSDKLTLGFTYVYMDIPPLSEAVASGVPDYLRVRGRSIMAATFEYGLYSPVLLPSLHLGSIRPYRTPTRGWYFYGGWVRDNEVFGDHRTINDTYYAGTRLEGPGAFNYGITEALYQGGGTVVDQFGNELPNESLAGATTLRSTFVLAAQIVNPDAVPGVPKEVGPFASDTLNLVFPVSYDHALAGVDYFENFRVGSQVWWKVFATGIWGTTFLTTVGYDYQYFFRVNKHMHNVSATVRMGWGDL